MNSHTYQDLMPLWTFNKTHDIEEYKKGHKALTCNVKELVPQQYWQFLEPTEVQPDPNLREDFTKAFEFALNNYGIRPMEREIIKFKRW